jgi:hypothetical protein
MECRDLRHFVRSSQRIDTKIAGPFCQSPERVIRGAQRDVVRVGQDRCRTKVALRFGAGRSSLLGLELVRGKQLARSGGLAGGLDVLLQSARQYSAPVRTSFDGLPEGGARSNAQMPASREVRRQRVFVARVTHRRDGAPVKSARRADGLARSLLNLGCAKGLDHALHVA